MEQPIAFSKAGDWVTGSGTTDSDFSNALKVDISTALARHNTWHVTCGSGNSSGTTGIFSIDFYDEKNGFGVGGDYTKPEIDSLNKIKTNDGGKTWQVVGNGKLGYRSCVQYFPGGNGKKILTVGFKGCLLYTSDAADE